MSCDYQLLTWDTNLLGMPVVRIGAPELNASALRRILGEASDRGVGLAYWPSSVEIDSDVAASLSGRLVDRKITFTTDLRSFRATEARLASIVAPYDVSMNAGDLEALAVQSGEYSRFAVDPGFPRAKFIEMYRTWMRRSLAKELANEVLTIRHGAHVVGMVTLGDRDARGDIGLLAVDSSCRGRGYGELLVRAAQDWFHRREYVFGQVITRGSEHTCLQPLSKVWICRRAEGVHLSLLAVSFQRGYGAMRVPVRGRRRVAEGGRVLSSGKSWGW